MDSHLSNETQAAERLRQSLRHNLDAQILAALDDPEVVEIMLNPDQRLWIEKHGEGMRLAGHLPPHKSRMVVSLAATALGVTATAETPVIEGELPLDGSRFEGLLPPIVANPSFSIRKKAIRVFPLSQYVEQGVMSQEHIEVIETAIVEHKNILVVGGTGSGKTTLVNAIIDGISRLCPQDRLLILEDTSELRSQSENTVFLRASEFVPMQRLVRATMRLRPNRILVGEVRGGEALDLLKAWNTGHPGGVATVHANSALSGLIRLEQLIAEVSAAPMQTLIGEAVDMAIYIERHPEKGRQLAQILRVHEFDPLSMKYRHEYVFNTKMSEAA